MRIHLAILATLALSSGPAAASSFVELGEPAEAIPAITSEAAPSVLMLGAPAAPKPVAAAPVVDETETSSVGDPRADAAPRPGSLLAAAQRDADAEWNAIAAIKSPSVLYVGTPAPQLLGGIQMRQSVVTDARVLPMVMRGGMEGPAFPVSGQASTTSEEADQGNPINDAAKQDVAPEATETPAAEAPPSGEGGLAPVDGKS